MGDFNDPFMRGNNAAVQARTKQQNRANLMQMKLIGQSHPTGLTNNLLKLFEPRPPLEYKPPPEKRKCPPYTGMAQFVSNFAEPTDPEYAPPIVKGETPGQKKARIHQLRLEEGAKKAAEELEKYDPNNDPNISGDPYKTLFVARLNYETTESRVKREFEAYGPIKRVRLIADKETNKPRGYAFIEYMHTRDMKAAYKQADGRKIDNRRVLVDVERGRTVPNWRPRRLGGGLGTTRVGGEEVNQRVSGREQQSGGPTRSVEPRGHEERDREREKSRERVKEREREKSRERSHDKPRDREHREDRHHRDRDRKSDRDRDRDRSGRDRDRDRHRDRDRDRSGRDRSGRDRDRYRDKDREGDVEQMDRDHEHDRGRSRDKDYEYDRVDRHERDKHGDRQKYSVSCSNMKSKSMVDRPKSILKQSPLHSSSVSSSSESLLKESKQQKFAKSKLRVSINLPDNEISLRRSGQLSFVRDETETNPSLKTSGSRGISKVLKGKGVLRSNNSFCSRELESQRGECRSTKTVLEVLRELDADILALQDVKAEEEKDMKPLSDLAAALGMHYVFAESWAPEFGNAVLSKWPIKRSKVQKIFDDSDFRNVLKATIDVPQTGEVDFHCTLLDHLDENWRMKQINAIIESNERPHILAGGINSLDETDYSPERWTDIVKYYEEMGKPTPKVEVMKYLKNKQYTDAKDCAGECESVVIIAKGQNVQGTCKYGTRVDYILVSPDSPYKFVPGSYMVLSSKGTSDHHIVKVDVTRADDSGQPPCVRSHRHPKQKVVKIMDSNSTKGVWKMQTLDR